MRPFVLLFLFISQTIKFIYLLFIWRKSAFSTWISSFLVVFPSEFSRFSRVFAAEKALTPLQLHCKENFSHFRLSYGTTNRMEGTLFTYFPHPYRINGNFQFSQSLELDSCPEVQFAFIRKLSKFHSHFRLIPCIYDAILFK